MVPAAHELKRLGGLQAFIFVGQRSPLALLLTLLLLCRYQRQGNSCALEMPILVVWMTFPIHSFDDDFFAIHIPFSNEMGKLSWVLFNPNLFASNAGPAPIRSCSPGKAIARRRTPLAQSLLSVTMFTQ